MDIVDQTARVEERARSAIRDLESFIDHLDSKEEEEEAEETAEQEAAGAERQE